jgi:subtilisin family serine protease
MMKIQKFSKILVNIFILLGLTVGLFSSGSSLAQAPVTDDGNNTPVTIAPGDWYIVELDKPSLVNQAQSGAKGSFLNSSGKIDVNSQASQNYIDELKTDQAAFTAALVDLIPTAEVSRGYQVVLNAVAVHIPNSDLSVIQQLATIPGVNRISPQTIYTITLDYSLPLINAPDLWSQLGGRAEAGKGVKIADVDTGIDPTHDMFNGTGWSYPSTGTWPKGYCAEVADFCNGKIIAARFYAPTFDVNEDEELTPRDLAGHGSHTAGIAAGNIVDAEYGTSTPVISGVAPGAWLMVYKGLFKTVDGTTASGSNIMLAGAVEDAILDGADVINNSWGSTTIVKDSNDPLVRAYEAAVDAGIVVVFSNGNSGPDYNTSGSPGGESSKFIAVGASTTERAYYNTIMVTDTVPVSPTLESFPGNQFADIDPSAFPTTDIGPLPYVPTDLLGVPIVDTEPYSQTGWIALIPRGTYNFSDKLDNAIAYGASAVAMYTDAARTWKGGFTATERAIYTVMISYDLGVEARNWWLGHPDTAQMIIGYPVSPWLTETPDVIASFSSRGPNIELGIKPDVTAPGVNILSAYWDGSYQVLNGTSMAAPHVTGAAALLLQLHPDWTPAQVKSALMSTSSQTILDVDEVTPADVMTQGAGRIDLSVAGDPGLTFDEPSVSFGMLPQGSSDQVMINAADVAGTDEVYSVSVEETVGETGLVTFTTSTDELDMLAGGAESFTFSVDVGDEALPMDLEGNIVISGTNHLAHIPFWVRLIPAGTGDVLLVDLDESEATTDYGFTTIDGFPFGDYTDYYTSTLEDMGLTYDYWNMWDNLVLPRSVLDQYDKVVIWTGDYGGFLLLGGTDLYFGDSLNFNDLRNYLANGGKLLFTGQEALGDFYYRYFGYGPIDSLPSYVRGSSNDPLKDGVFPDYTPPEPSVVGVEETNPFLKDMVLDLSPGEDGAGNQMFVDEVQWINYIDLDTAPLFEVVNTTPGTVADGYVATRSSYEPTIERVLNPIDVPQEPVSWRAAELNFGLEGVNNETGFNTRSELLQALFDWQDDVVTVAFDEADYFAPRAFAFVDFTATGNSSLEGDMLLYRWDFGDGSGIQETTQPSISHQYQQIGIYHAYVEVTDSYSHKAVSMPVTVIVGYHIFMPIITR